MEGGDASKRSTEGGMIVLDRGKAAKGRDYGAATLEGKEGFLSEGK